jgi:glycine cleavage system H protein
MSVDARARYAESHEYARLEGKELVVGISDHAQAELGDIVFVELPSVGKTFAKGQIFGTIESVKAASDLYMPVAGIVSAVNESLQGDPSLVNREPYEGGWLLKVAPSNAQELDSLLDATAYAKLAGEA